MNKKMISISKIERKNLTNENKRHHAAIATHHYDPVVILLGINNLLNI